MAVNAPVALVALVEPDRLRPVLFGPAKSGSFTPAWNCPAMEMRPASAADFLAFEYVPLSVRATGRGVAETAETVPATLAVPTPGLYGVQIDVQRYWPAVEGFVKMPALNVSTASTSLIPSGERPGVPAGTSSGGRQNVIFDVPSACSAPVVMSKNAASSSALPAAVSLNTQYAVCVVVPVHDSASCDSGTGTPLTRAVPVAGARRSRPARARSPRRGRRLVHVASTVPMIKPAVPPFDGEADRRVHHEPRRRVVGRPDGEVHLHLA